jgi:hypothetical protein
VPDTAVTIDPAALDAAFNGALAADAERHESAAAPPRVPWLNEDGSARWGVKADGTPRRAKPGTGRPPADGTDKARTTDKPPGDTSAATAAKAGSDGAPRDYTEDIGAALTMVWMGAAAIPWTKAHAAIIRAQTPVMAPAWNQAAQQNATVRRYVQKLSGEGSWSWVLPVTVVTTPVLMGFWQVMRDRDLRASLAAQTDRDFQAFIIEQARAAGMTIPEDGSTSASPEPGSPQSPESFQTD